MKNLLAIFFIGVLVCFTISSAQALTVGGNAPHVSGTGSDAAINAQLDANYVTLKNAAYNELVKYSNQPELAKGFGNANAYAANAATLQGYQDYSLFAVMVGVMAGAQLPSSNKDYYEDLDKKVKEKGDLYIGASASLALNVGINAGFIYPGLYLNVKGGYFSKDDISNKLSVKNTLLGVGANYTWLQSDSFLLGFVKWRGISFGTGFLFNKSELNLKLDLDTLTQPVTGLPIGPLTSGTLFVDPSVKLGVKSTTYSIPFDVITSVRLLWFLNFNLGAGVDFNFGYTDIVVKSNGNVRAELNGGAIQATGGTFTVDSKTKAEKPSLIRPKIMTGLGFNIAVVKIDVPVIIYPTDNAFAVGLSAGVVW